MPSSDGSNGRILSFNQSLQSSNSPEGLARGSGYTPGTYTDVPLTGGSGTGARGTVVVGEDGTVSSVSLSVFGKDYQSGESLSVSDAKLGGSGGSGFSVDVSTVDITPPSFDDVLRNVFPTLGN
ncbi:MAG: hypothetical protein VKM17_04745 [Cyanobacteriota bacterium]|nr:hypothetical protein [Cyanobacteriota bacterium]